MRDMIQHDCAWLTTTYLMQLLAGVFRDDERQEAFSLIFKHIKGTLESYETIMVRELQRIHPSKN